LAAVIAKPPFIPYDELVIDIGKDYKIAVGDKVYGSGDVLIGKVTDVLADTSKVLLFSSPQQRYDVLIGPKNITAVAIGRGGGQYYAEISREVSINKGDFVHAPSLSSRPLGVVEEIITDSTQPFAVILISSVADLYNIRWVSLLEKSK
jgi:cell shape-determining protein MreC